MASTTRFHRPALGFVLSIVAVASAGAQRADRPPKPAKMKPTEFRDAAGVPFRLRYEIATTLPGALVGDGFAVEAASDKSIGVDIDGDGKADKRVTAGKPGVVVVNKGDDGVPLLVFRDGSRWSAAPARCLTGKIGKQRVVLLDADLDGAFDGENDWVAFGNGCLHRIGRRKIIADGEVIYSFELRPSGAKLELAVQHVAKPDWANALQWRALHAVNEFRNRAGLTPMLLDEERSKGCQLHAKYLYLNNYDFSKPWDGVGSHDEVPGNPGYTKAGHRASHTHGTSGQGDPARAISGQVRTMLHRLGYCGGDMLGAGAIDQCQNSSASGYSVVGAGKPDISRLEDLLVVPAPGARGVPTLIKSERPRVERDPAFYQKARGYPISVTFGSVPITDIRIDVVQLPRREIPGTLFTPAEPIHSTRPRNGQSAFFVPDKPWTANKVYRVRFRARLRGQAIERTWSFRP